MVNPNTSVPVLDSNSKVISKTTPAKARILIKNSKASIFSDDPFMIMLKDQFTKEKVMASSFFSFFEYMKEERPIYAQNMSNGVLAFGFRTSSGQEIPVQIPNTPKPFCFTDFVSFEMLKESLDLRKMVGREPKVLRLLTEEEFVGYYEGMAKLNGTSMEEEMAKGRRAHAGISDRNKMYAAPVKETPKSIAQMKEAAISSEVEEQPTPKVIGLCAKVSQDLIDDHKMPEEDLIERLLSMDGLNDTDLDYIQSHGYYKKVKSWAAAQIELREKAKKSS